MSEMAHTDADSDAGLPDDSDEVDDEIEVWNPYKHIDFDFAFAFAFAQYKDHSYPKNNVYKVFILF